MGRYNVTLRTSLILGTLLLCPSLGIAQQQGPGKSNNNHIQYKYTAWTQVGDTFVVNSRLTSFADDIVTQSGQNLRAFMNGAYAAPGKGSQRMDIYYLANQDSAFFRSTGTCMTKFVLPQSGNQGTWTSMGTDTAYYDPTPTNPNDVGADRFLVSITGLGSGVYTLVDNSVTASQGIGRHTVTAASSTPFVHFGVTTSGVDIAGGGPGTQLSVSDKYFATSDTAEFSYSEGSETILTPGLPQWALIPLASVLLVLGLAAVVGRRSITSTASTRS